jgi:hypothetical protein
MNGFIFELENVLPENICREIIQKFEIDERKQPGAMTRGIDKSVKNGVDLYINSMKDWDLYSNMIAKEISKGLSAYLDHLSKVGLNKRNVVNSILHKSKILFPQLQKTPKGGFYNWHTDSREDRILTYILYLNDIEEDCGGSTDFCCGRSVLPKRGKLLIFPSTWNYIHRGQELKKGAKYIATGFILNDLNTIENKVNAMT